MPNSHGLVRAVGGGAGVEGHSGTQQAAERQPGSQAGGPQPDVADPAAPATGQPLDTAVAGGAAEGSGGTAAQQDPLQHERQDAALGVCTVAAQVLKQLPKSRRIVQEMDPVAAAAEGDDDAPAQQSLQLAVVWYAQAAIVCTNAALIASTSDYRPSAGPAPRAGHQPQQLQDPVSVLLVFGDGEPAALSGAAERSLRKGAARVVYAGLLPRP